MTALFFLIEAPLHAKQPVWDLLNLKSSKEEIMEINMRRWSLGRVLPLTFILIAIGCTHDPYQQRADVMKDHVESFYELQVGSRRVRYS